MTLPLALTMGDPSGIGPEITAQLLTSSSVQRPLIGIGDLGVFERAMALIGEQGSLKCLDSIDHFDVNETKIQLLQAGDELNLPSFGELSAQNGAAAYNAINMAVDLALGGQVAGVVTAPIHKEAFAMADVPFPGHTELLEHRAKCAGFDNDAAMMLANDDIRTVLVSIHISLSDAVKAVSFEAEMKAIKIAHQAALDLGIKGPRIGVAGLNPHAGEGGLFGTEEIEFIEPAIRSARDLGIDASGPWSGDTVFMQAREGKFDVVVAQYHDQGLIPVKYLGLEKGVNVTLGLPFIRTSPDHGTAFDIAGTGKADSQSMFEAAKYAWQMWDANA